MTRALLTGLLLGLVPCWGQPGSELPLSLQAARELRTYYGSEACSHAVRWVFALDISGSMAGPLLDGGKAALADLLNTVVARGDEVLLLPFDDQVDPPLPDAPRRAFLVGDATGSEEAVPRGSVSAALTGLTPRPGRRGTALTGALQATLRRVAAAAPRYGIGVILTDRMDDDEQARLARSQLAVPGVRRTAAGLLYVHLPLESVNRDGRQVRLELFHCGAAKLPAGALALAGNRSLPQPEAPTQPRSRTVVEPHHGWLLGGVVLLLAGLSATCWGWRERQQKVHLHWEGSVADGTPAVLLSPGESEPLTARAGIGQPGGYLMHFDSADGRVDEALGSLAVTQDGVTLATTEEYRLRQSGRVTAVREVEVRRGQGPVELEFLRANGHDPLRRQPLTLEIGAAGANAGRWLLLGGGLVCGGLLLLLTVGRTERHQEWIPAPPPESFCG
ncbi:MAG: VWA domain-containing protein [Fimbriimonadaceae bacterium]|nr:VWA domain-containing protein [Fimbriimonadaceae bacterium]